MDELETSDALRRAQHEWNTMTQLARNRTFNVLLAHFMLTHGEDYTGRILNRVRARS